MNKGAMKSSFLMATNVDVDRCNENAEIYILITGGM